ncbi:MAG: polyprenyl synthetase family protein [Acidobacteriota bacterium]|nr:polyprenyl synthetase family protein [Acidobacteriota bacterium]
MVVERTTAVIGFGVFEDAGAGESTADLAHRVENRLGVLVPSDGVHPQTLHRSMRYSLLSGGKRIRPLLTVQVATDFGAPEADAMDTACAIEMIHSASLILDDMPCMDDATLRRGQPTNHLEFGEDTAILAATALLNRAFGVIAECERLPAEVRLDLVKVLSDAVGSNGIIAGQYCDLRTNWNHTGGNVGLTDMYARKTGALFVAAVEAGARIAAVEESWIRAVREYALNLGLAFQLLDDLLDTFSSREDLGKDIGQDGDKTTLASRLGADEARLEVCRYVKSAASALAPLGDSGIPLVDLARSYTEPAMERVLFL